MTSESNVFNGLFMMISLSLLVIVFLMKQQHQMLKFQKEQNQLRDWNTQLQNDNKQLQNDNQQLQNDNMQLQISVQGLVKDVNLLKQETGKSNEVDTGTHTIQLAHGSHPICQEFWRQNKQKLMQFVQYLDAKDRHFLSQVNKYFYGKDGIGETELNNLCLQYRSDLRWPNLLKIFQTHMSAYGTYRYKLKKTDDQEDQFAEFYESTLELAGETHVPNYPHLRLFSKNNKLFPENPEGKQLSGLRMSYEFSRPLHQLMFGETKLEGADKLMKPIRLVVNMEKEFTLTVRRNLDADYEDNGNFECELTKGNNESCIIRNEHEELLYEHENCNNVAIFLCPKTNMIGFYNIEAKKVISSDLDRFALIRHPTGIDFDMAPAQYDFYFTTWPENWPLVQ